MKITILAAIVFVGIALAPAVKALADSTDPLALPCTVGVSTSKDGHAYKCEQCGSETCWIMQN